MIMYATLTLTDYTTTSTSINYTNSKLSINYAIAIKK